MFNASVREAVTAVALRRDLEPAALLAVAHTESAGVAFWTVDGRQVPALRIEGHYFYRRLSGDKRARAIREGLAHKNAGVVKNPNSWAGRYKMLKRMREIDVQAALESCSWGLGQVMGAHWKALGYKSVQEMVGVAMSGVEGQLDLMIRFIDVNNLRRLIDARKWHPFARAYNGPAYRKNRYAAKMASAYKRFSKPSTDLPDPFVLQVQKDLRKLGFDPGALDGRDGTNTKKAVKAFQAANGLIVDGIAGPMTLEEIETDLAALADNSSVKQTKVGTGVGIAGGAGAGAAQQATEQLQSATDTLQPLAQLSSIIMWLFIGLTVVGAGVALWNIFKPKQGAS